MTPEIIRETAQRTLKVAEQGCQETPYKIAWDLMNLIDWDPTFRADLRAACHSVIARYRP